MSEHAQEHIHEHGHGHRPEPHETQIIVNGRRRTVLGDEVTFAEVVELAYPGPHIDPNVIFSVTYHHAASHPSHGELAAGGKVEVKRDTVFNVTRTVKS
jgi:hypothetical protein